MLIRYHLRGLLVVIIHKQTVDKRCYIYKGNHHCKAGWCIIKIYHLSPPKKSKSQKINARVHALEPSWMEANA